MEGMTGGEALNYVKCIIDAATIVYGVYPDVASPNGVGLHIIKSLRELQVVIASGKADLFKIDAISCIELEQAVAAAKVLGDGQVKSDG
jgi:hypothetical protein